MDRRRHCSPAHKRGSGINNPGLSHRYHQRVFLTPSWPEIYVQDSERRHGLDRAMEEYTRLLKTYPTLGYNMDILPKISLKERADFILSALNR
ncbi:AAA family ATPase [Chromobacterium alticapitis]|uniref:AAA family ATPase n=1 Tax=Chromobacterium alticapitis TaxID=2073169 RepID=UPI0034E1E472